MDEKTKKIAALNDDLRTTFNAAKGRIILTHGINGLPETDQIKIFNLVKSFNDFSEDNDPYGEHDFGKVQHNGQDVFWKFDYYDPNIRYHSEDASDPDKTVRVMTVMLANEY